MWAFDVVDPPCFDDPACRGQAAEEVLVRHSSRNRPLKLSTNPFERMDWELKLRSGKRRDAGLRRLARRTLCPCWRAVSAAATARAL